MHKSSTKNIVVFTGINLLQGAVAWQSSTFVELGVHLIAEKALDGNVQGIHNCAHTKSSYSYWAVEFGTPGPVKSVQIKSRRDCCCKISIFIFV
jgi:hypothetical protein